MPSSLGRNLCVVALMLAAATLIVFPDAARRLGSRARTLLQPFTPTPSAMPYPPPPARETWKTMSAADRLADVRERVEPLLHQELAGKGLAAGDQVFIRIFKESRELELWMRDASGVWKLYRNYPIACHSGVLGPKQREGDMQAPEGFYSVARAQLNAASNYHLAFNIGYPNAYDLHHQRTGSLIMVHGDEVSVGCYAMTDPVIEAIYLLLSAALENGQPGVPVHCFPFRLSADRLRKAGDEKSPWMDFWSNLQEGYDAFEEHRKPPRVDVRDGRYVFRAE